MIETRPPSAVAHGCSLKRGLGSGPPVRDPPSVPVLSFVVAAHDVAPYIEQCLRSLLSTDADVDVVVVDDASTDATPDLIERVATEDRRVRVVTHERPAGPGGARNAGLEVAAGAYVWFVDGDDWLLDGAVAAVVDLLDGSVDVVMVDHVRAYPSGRLAPSGASAALHLAPRAPTTLASWPDISTLLHTPWNKVLRRGFLDRHSLRFSQAPVYEDVSFTYHALRAAERILLHPQSLYAYRTARPGALTRTSGAEHLAWFAEWTETLRAASADPLVVRRALFDRMLWHGWSVIGLRNGRRIPLSLRRQFAREFVQMYRTFRPVEAPKDRTLELGWWPLVEVRVIAQWVRWAAGRSLARVGVSRRV